MSGDRVNRRGGFTLLELLIAIGILAVVSAICLGAFVSVANSIETARAVAMNTRSQQFMQRYFYDAISAAVYDYRALSPEYGPRLGEWSPNAPVILFEGVNQTGPHGSADALRFFSTAPTLGGTGLPGELKEVQIEFFRAGEGADEAGGNVMGEVDDDLAQRAGRIQIVEYPTLNLSTDRFRATTNRRLTGEGQGAMERTDTPFMFEIDGVESFDVKYFDGAQWLDAWDWEQQGRMMPWAVDIRVVLAKNEAARRLERDEGIDPEDDPDFRQIIPIRTGMGNLLLPEQLPLDFPAFPILQPAVANVPPAQGGGGGGGQRTEGRLPNSGIGSNGIEFRPSGQAVTQ